MGSLACFCEQKLGSPRNHSLAELREGLNKVFKIVLLWTPAIQSDHIGGERRLQRRIAIKLIEHDVSHRIALQLDDHAIAIAVGLVAHVGNAFDTLLANQFRDAFLENALC